MLKTATIISLLTSITFYGAACARGHGAALGETAMAHLEAEQAQTGGARRAAGFVPVEGADLAAKFEAAARAARSSGRTPFWTAYSFDVRPGVAVDPGGGEFRGSMDTVGGIHVFIGTARGGMTAETRNLAVFVLRDPASGAVTRMEVYNLDREREYSGYPVYFAGRAANEESLAYLRPLVEQQADAKLQERATLAVALHDDRRVADALKGFIRTSKNERVRSTAAFWLGQAGGETEFLAALVRDDRERTDLRRVAAHAIGASRDQAALSTLQGLYTAVAPKEVKRGILHAVSENENREAAYAFILKVAQTDPDREARRTGVHLLGESRRESAVDDLMKIFAAERDTDVRRTVIHALSEVETPRADAKLIELARTAESADLRRHAIHQLGERGDSAFEELSRIFDADRSQDVRRQVLHAFSEMDSPRAEEKLFEVARRSEDRELRKQAIHWIGEKASQKSLEFLKEAVGGDGGDAEVQIQALHAISEKPAEQAVPVLIQVARTHPNQRVRRAAIHWLGESGDPRALEFFREVLSK